MWKLLLVISLVGCGGKSRDWTGKKSVTETVVADGVTFTIDIPEGLPKDSEKPGNWDDVHEEYDHIPKIFTSIRPADMMPADETAAMHDAALDVSKANFVRKDKRPDGWALTDANSDKHRIEAWSVKKAGAKMIECTAVQVNDGELPSYDKTKAMLEAICDSVKPK